jgi:hypothetical protein
VAAFKRALLETKSIAFSRLGASGLHFAQVIERLGIADEIRRKATISDSYVGEMAARGEVEMAVQQISELVPVAGIDIVGPLPGELQKISGFSGVFCRVARMPINRPTDRVPGVAASRPRADPQGAETGVSASFSLGRAHIIWAPRSGLRDLRRTRNPQFAAVVMDSGLPRYARPPGSDQC